MNDILGLIGMGVVVVGIFVFLATIIIGFIGFLTNDYKYFKLSLKVLGGCIVAFLLVLLVFALNTLI